MAQVKTTFSGGVVAAPETFTFPDGNKQVTFPVYVNHSRKNKDTGEYEDTGDVTKIRVQLRGDLSTFDVRMGDIVEVEGTLVEKEFEKRDGGKGRALQTEFVNSIVTKYRKDGASAPAAETSGEGWAGGSADTPW